MYGNSASYLGKAFENLDIMDRCSKSIFKKKIAKKQQIKVAKKISQILSEKANVLNSICTTYFSTLTIFTRQSVRPVTFK